LLRYGKRRLGQTCGLAHDIFPHVAARTIQLGTGQMAMGVVRRHFICALVSTTVAWPLAACAQQPAGVVPSGNEAYKIGPLDVLDVTVFKVPDLSKTVQVDRNGTITYPLIGEIPAAGKTARELARDLAQRLNAKYLRSPQITITIKQYNNK
jgi:protein involved in polysaccharide export with SLBB domain